MVTAIVARLLSTVLGTLYPAFASFQTLRDGRTQDVVSGAHMLTCVCVCAGVCVCVCVERERERRERDCR